MRAPRLLAIVVVVMIVPIAARADVWTRTRPDGTVEFTNGRPPGAGKGKTGGWKASRDARTPPQTPAALSSGVAAAESGGAVASRAAPAPAPAPAAGSGGTFWAREREGGVVEFTNIQPVGRAWKVWLKTGPGKAAAVRGRTDVVPARDASPERYARYDAHIRDQIGFYGIPEPLVRAVIKTESDFDPHVVSSAGARGLMQLMPETARSMGVTDIFEPRQNIMGGSRYLQLLARRFCKTPAAAGGGGAETVCSRDEMIKVLAGYHAGPGAVEKYRGMPPYETTRSYVTTVMRRYDQYARRPAAASGPVADRGAN